MIPKRQMKTHMDPMHTHFMHLPIRSQFIESLVSVSSE